MKEQKTKNRHEVLEVLEGGNKGVYPTRNQNIQ